MKDIILIDYTEEFRKLLKDNSNKNLDSGIDFSEIKDDTEDSREQIDNREKIIRDGFKTIDTKIEELKQIVDKTCDFDVTIESQCQLFNDCTNQITVMLSNMMVKIKPYKEKQPLVFRHYVLILKEKFTQVDKIATSFKKSDIIAKAMDQLSKELDLENEKALKISSKNNQIKKNDKLSDSHGVKQPSNHNAKPTGSRTSQSLTGSFAKNNFGEENKNEDRSPYKMRYGEDFHSSEFD